jgi:hypothetical protein
MKIELENIPAKLASPFHFVVGNFVGTLNATSFAGRPKNSLFVSRLDGVLKPDGTYDITIVLENAKPRVLVDGNTKRNLRFYCSTNWIKTLRKVRRFRVSGPRIKP